MMFEISLAIIAGTVFSISALYQIAHLSRTKSAESINLIFIVLLITGVIATLGLAILTSKSMWFIYERAINTILYGVICIQVIYYKNKNKNKNKNK